MQDARQAVFWDAVFAKLLRSLHGSFTNIKLYKDFKKIDIVFQLSISPVLKFPYIVVKHTPYFYGN